MIKNKILFGFLSFFLTCGAFIIAYMTQSEYNEFILWSSFEIIIISGIINISLWNFLHLFIGSIIFFISLYQCFIIIRINQEVHIAKNHPGKIIKEGYYGKVRHPMTARFIFITFSFFFMMRSLLGFLIFLFILTLLIGITFYEEKNILIPMFEQDYKQYMIQVKERFFTYNVKFVILLLLCFICFGIVLM